MFIDIVIQFGYFTPSMEDDVFWTIASGMLVGGTHPLFGCGSILLP